MKKPILIVLVGVFFVISGMMIMPTIASGDTIWYLQNLDNPVCSSCHVENKKGHFTKNECDKCHEPGAKKEVHNIPAIYWNVDDPDEWASECGYCHTDNKTGHMEKKEECIRCHGPGEKKDVHVEMAYADLEEGCLTCHSEPVGGPQDHLDNCNACHMSK